MVCVIRFRLAVGRLLLIDNDKDYMSTYADRFDEFDC